MIISVVVVTLNDADTIQDTIESLKAQEHRSTEYVLQDRGSQDETLSIAEKSGVFDEINSDSSLDFFESVNQGIRNTTGDAVGVLRGGDMLYDDQSLWGVSGAIESKKSGACWGDVLYVNQNNPSKSLKYWRASGFEMGKFEMGWMPPAESFFASRSLFNECGFFQHYLSPGADYELMLRFLKVCEAEGEYLSKPLVKVRKDPGGRFSIENFKEFMNRSKNYKKAWKMNGLEGGLLAPILNPLFRVKTLKSPSKIKRL